MSSHRTVFVGLNIRNDSIVAAYSVGCGEVQNIGQFGLLDRDIDSSRKAKASRLPVSAAK